MNYPASFSIISDEISQELPEVRRFVRSFNLPGFELRSMFGRAFKDLTRADVAEVAAAVRGEGWRVHGCASPVFKCAIDDAAAIQDHLELFKRSLETAQALECDLVRVFTFLRRPAALDEATAATIAGHLRKLIDLAAGSGVRVGVENEGSCIIATGEEVLQLRPKLPAAGWGVIWDPCNALYVPGAAFPPTRLFPQLLPSIIHIHVKDSVRRDVPGKQLCAESVPVGVGEVDWRAHFAEIKRSGYQGMLSLETHWRVEHIDEGLLHLPAGYAFSKGGEEASRTCLRNIQGLWPVLA